jgi:hypothetical protein
MEDSTSPGLQGTGDHSIGDGGATPRLLSISQFSGRALWIYPNGEWEYLSSRPNGGHWYSRGAENQASERRMR